MAGAKLDYQRLSRGLCRSMGW